MKRILMWLKVKLPRFRSVDLPNASDESGKIHSTNVDLRIIAPKVIQEPTKNVPTSVIDADKSNGFDPYDTGTLQVK